MSSKLGQTALSVEMECRTGRLHQLLRDHDLDALVGFGSKDRPGAAHYLSGFEPWCAPGERALAIVRRDDRTLVHTNSPWDLLAGVWADATWVEFVRGTDWTELGLAAATERSRLGLVDADSWPMSVYDAIAHAAGGRQLIDVTAAVDELRALKSAYELERLEEANAIAWSALHSIAPLVEPGRPEREVAAALAGALEHGGALGLAYPTTMMSGLRTAAVCARPAEQRLVAGEVLQIDCSPIVAGYAADVSWVFPIGELTSNYRQLLEASRATCAAVAAALVDGAAGDDCFAAATAALLTHGLDGDNLYRSVNTGGQFVAHGLGLANPDPPGMVAPGMTRPLRPGMVINVEPIVVIPGVGSARTETAYLLTAGGSPRLLGTDASARLLPETLDADHRVTTTGTITTDATLRGSVPPVARRPSEV